MVIAKEVQAQGSDAGLAEDQLPSGTSRLRAIASCASGSENALRTDG